MPKCMVCKQTYSDNDDLALVRDHSGRWVMTCKICREQGKGPIPSKPEEVEVVDEDAGGTNREAIADILTENAPTAHVKDGSPEVLLGHEVEEVDAAFERIREALHHLDEDELAEAEPHVHERTHERQVADLSLEFFLQRDDESRRGHILDLSEGGLRFVTRRWLQKGQILRLSVGTSESKGQGEASSASNENFLQSTAEVLRVIEKEDGQYEVGARFVQRSRARGDNRRRYRRRIVAMEAYYILHHCDYMARAAVVDISQGGVSLYLEDKVEVGNLFQVTLRNAAAGSRPVDLCGKAKVVRIEAQEHGVTKVGCAFLKIAVRPRPSPEEKPSEG